MSEEDLEKIRSWLIESGLCGLPETQLLHGFCERCEAAGVALSHAVAVIDTLHPVYEGRAFLWRAGEVTDEPMIEYGSKREDFEEERWRRSPFHHLLVSGENEIRRSLCSGDISDFSMLDDLRSEGHTDYVALIHRFANEGIIGEMDCVYSHWSTKCATGFTDGDLEVLRKLVPSFALSLKCASLARIAGTLVEVYLGRDAGQRVLSGKISRGVTDRINAVLWFSDLRGYTRIADSGSPEQVIPLLNDYADVVISSILEAGGDVLKLIGDGTLAIFKAPDPAEACCCAMKAEAKMRKRVSVLNHNRTAAGQPVTSVYLGLHIGDVFYGNIGGDSRLDFTVVGPAVNEVSRIASMCRSVDRPVLFSAAFRETVPQEEKETLVSVGRFALRGIGRAQELFTLDPASDSDRESGSLPEEI